MFLPSTTGTTTQSSPSTIQDRSTTPSPSTCGFPGNPDIYGPGIRLGIYAQILAVYISNYFLSSEAQVLRDSVSIFSLAILIISFLSALHPSEMYAVEEFILLQILAWSCLMSVSSKSSNGREKSKSTVVRRCVNEGMNLGMLGLHVWFWWVGVGEMKGTPCGTWLMYVVKTDMLGWAREVMKWITVLYLVATVKEVAEEVGRAVLFWKLRVAWEEFGKAVRAWGGNGLVLTAVGGAFVEVHDCKYEGRSPCTGIRVVTTPCDKDQDLQSCSMKDECQSAAPRSLSSSSAGSGPALDETSSSMRFPDQAILRDVYDCERYIQHCIDSRSPYFQNVPKIPPTPLSLIRTIFTSKKSSQSSILSPSGRPTSSRTSWLHCQLHIWKAFVTFSFPRHALVIYSHLLKSKQMDPINGPFQLYAALKYDTTPGPDNTTSKHIPPHWSSVCLASSILLARPEASQKRWLFWYYALCDLTIHIAVILQLELTLLWNNVGGITSLWGSVGQLIPFIIGVGGLGLVGSRLVAKWWSRKGGKEEGKGGWFEERVQETELFGLEFDVREGYTRWKESCGGSSGGGGEAGEV